MHLPQRHTRRRSHRRLTRCSRSACCCRPSGDRRRRRRAGRAHASARRRTWTRSNPFNTELVVGYEAFQLTYNLLTEFDKDAARRRRASRTRGSGPPTASRSTSATGCSGPTASPRPRPTSATRGASRMAAIDRRVEHRLGLPRSGAVKDAGRHQDRVPRRHDVRRLHRGPVGPDLPDLRADPARAHLRRARLQADRRGEVRRAARRAPARTRSSSGRPASSRGSCATPTTGARRASPTRSCCSFFADATDTMIQALKAGELDYAHNVNADQFKQLATDPAVHRRRRRGQRLDAARVQHLRHRDRQDDRGRRPVDEGAARPGVPRRPRLRGRQATPSSSACSAASATRARRSSRRSCPTGTSSPTTPRTFDLDARQAEARRGGLRPRRRRASGSTRRATRSPSALVHPNTSDDYSEVRPVREGVVRGARHRRVGARATTATRSPTCCCRPRRTARRSTTSSCGAGPGARTRTA